MGKFKMSVDLNVLNHLGINLYSNVPAVLAEVVANAWDADATSVKVDIDTNEEKITIEDNGHGMNLEEVNNKYLTVGYQRRTQGEEKTPQFKRPVMGRKGIGKLSLFSVAENIRVETRKGGGEPQGFSMTLLAIKNAIQAGENDYSPEETPQGELTLKTCGTKIIITGLKKRISSLTPEFLKKRLARRFSILGGKNQFEVMVNNSVINVADRDYFHKLQYIWTFGPDPKEFDDLAPKADERTYVENDHFSGWIGTVRESGDLLDGKENLNKIVVMMRGKLAEEDILATFGEKRVFASYIIGEIRADSLDDDDQDDIATSNRQSINEDDDRFIKLKEAIKKELKVIGSKWTDYRNQSGTKKALDDSSILKWFNSLPKATKSEAEKLFGKIYQMYSDNEERRTQLFRYGILAFEQMRVHENLGALEELDANNIVEFGRVFEQTDSLEASMYYQITQVRLKVVEKLAEKVEDDVLERILQEHIFDHLWLIEPSWERATSGTEYMERSVTKEFGKVVAGLTNDEKTARVDIKYRTTAGKHIIIELKRASVKTDTLTLIDQIVKYRNALQKCLDDVEKGDAPIEVVCLIGCPLKDYSDKNGKENSKKMLEIHSASVITYKQLIDEAYEKYFAYTEKSKEAGDLRKLLNSIGSKI